MFHVEHLIIPSEVFHVKHEWRKAEKLRYFSKQPTIVELPEIKYLTISGLGNPNESPFQERIQTLYPLAYAIRMALKQGQFGKPYEYTVYPLEGIWTTTDGSRGETLNKDALSYKIMIRQPDQVTREMFENALATTKSKKSLPLIDQVQFEVVPATRALQMIHVGPFDSEGETFAKMTAYLAENNLTRTTIMGDYQHREIYLSDFRRVASEKLKTLLQYQLE